MNKRYHESLERLLSIETPVLPKEIILKTVQKTLALSGFFESAKQQFGSPLYVIDEPALIASAGIFSKTFGKYFNKFSPYFAMKSNNHPYIIKTLALNGFGIDVSSGAEMQTALDAGAERLVFSGPAKTEKELRLALCNADRVIVLMDSRNELIKLSKLADEMNVRIRAGVRITAHTNPLWRKFGIHLDSLKDFIIQTNDCSNIDFCGIQFHSSWNLTPDNHCSLIKSIGGALALLPAEMLAQIEFVDIGGGYWVADGEWMLAETAAENKIKKHLSEETGDPLDHRYLPSCGIDDYASAIAEAFEKHIRPYVDCMVFAEPGRFVSHDCMHILLSVEDIKESDIAVTDGATNLLGWERYEMDYFPVINISSPSLTEKPMNILGSLCTPHDVWGFAYFGGGINLGDTIIIPSQGAYTYSLRQNFIKEIPLSVIYDGISVRAHS